jgi:hypothetical protein
MMPAGRSIVVAPLLAMKNGATTDVAMTDVAMTDGSITK